MPRFKDPFEEKPKRTKEEGDRPSWREVDARRNKSTHVSREPDGRERKESARTNSAAYQGYKRDLDKVFSGGEVPDYLKNLMPQDEARSGQLKKLGAITRAESQAELEKAVAEYRAEYTEFPNDCDILIKLLDVPDEALQLQALRQAEAVAAASPLPHKRQFALKTQSLAMLADDDDLRELAERLTVEWR